MATIYLTSVEGPRGFEKLVVVKEMRGELAEDPEFRHMFIEEARVSASLDHPNVVQTLDVHESAGVFAIVMEFLDGQSLSKLRASARREVILPLQLYIVARALAGLAHVHASGLIHRDVSPQNIFVTYEGDVKLLDFGIVKSRDSSVLTAVGTLKGKLGYMAPEQALGKPVDERTDVFAMGVVLWEALTGTRLWANVAEAAIVGRLSFGNIPRVHSIKSDVPEELTAICLRAMHADPDERFATALDFQEALEAFITKIKCLPTRCDLAQLMKSLFTAERERLRAVIDRAIENPLLQSDELLVGLSALPPLPPSGLTVPPTAVTVRFAKRALGQESASGGGATTRGLVPEPAAAPHRQTLIVGALALAATLAVGIAIGIVARRPAAPTTAASTAASSAPSSAPSPPPRAVGGPLEPAPVEVGSVAPAPVAPASSSRSPPASTAVVTGGTQNQRGSAPATETPPPSKPPPKLTRTPGTNPDLGY